jgi:hypothetical protein
MWELSEKKHLVRLLLLSPSFQHVAPGMGEDLPLQHHKLKDVPHRDVSSALDSQSMSVSPSAPTSSWYCPAPISVDTPTDRLLELRLFHHYLKMAFTPSASSLADAGDTVGQHTWSIWITELAVDTPTLMDAPPRLLRLSSPIPQSLRPNHFRSLTQIHGASHKLASERITRGCR